jgi:type II secretory pathway pseudopilin PulG
LAIGHRQSAVSRRSAFTLIECIVYLALVAVIIGFTFAAFYHAWDNHRDLRRNTEDIVLALKAGERWRADVRAATGPLKTVDQTGLSALHIPQANGEIVYVFRDEMIRRRAGPHEPWQQILANVKSSRMFAAQRNEVRSWRWEMELTTAQKAVRVRPLFSFQAVPGLFNRVEEQ